MERIELIGTIIASIATLLGGAWLIIKKSLLLIKHKESQFSMKKSPRQLNTNGAQIYNDINGEKFLMQHKDYFFSKIDKIAPKTALDVEGAAYVVCTESTKDEIFNGIKSFVYNAPTYTLLFDDGKELERDITLLDVCYILSIQLRDLYLSEHTEIPR